MQAFIKMKTKDKSFNQFVEFEGLSIENGTMHLFKANFSPVGTVANNVINLPEGKDMAWELANVTEFKMINSR